MCVDHVKLLLLTVAAVVALAMYHGRPLTQTWLASLMQVLRMKLSTEPAASKSLEHPLPAQTFTEG